MLVSSMYLFTLIQCSKIQARTENGTIFKAYLSALCTVVGLWHNSILHFSQQCYFVTRLHSEYQTILIVSATLRYGINNASCMLFRTLRQIVQSYTALPIVPSHAVIKQGQRCQTCSDCIFGLCLCRFLLFNTNFSHTLKYWESGKRRRKNLRNLQLKISKEVDIQWHLSFLGI